MKVLFRFGLALLPLENKLSYLDAKEGDNRIGDLINQMKEDCTHFHDVELLRKIAFRSPFRIPGRRELRVKRSIYLQRIQESLLAAKAKEDRLNEALNNSEQEMDVLSLDQTDDEDNEKQSNENVFRKNHVFKRSSSSAVTQPAPVNRLNWLKKRLSLVNFYPLSMQRQEAAAQKNSVLGLNGIRSCEAISRNGEKLVQMISSIEHHQSRVLLQLRDTHYSHIFYPNRRSSIVLTDSEQHQNAILTLRNLYNKDLFLIGVSDDGKWIVLLEQMTKKFHCGWLNDSNVNVLILSVPFSVRSWYFDELSWQVFCLDKDNQLWRCDLADPARSSLCTDFLKKQINQEPKSNHLNMLAYDDKYCLLWVHMCTKISLKDQTEEALKRSSFSERMTLSLDLSNDENDLQANNLSNNNHLETQLNESIDLAAVNNNQKNKKQTTKKVDTVFFKSSLEDLDDDDEEEEEDELDNQNDLCSCSTESNTCDHLIDNHLIENDDELFKNEFLENSECVKNCTEKCVLNAPNLNNEPIANRLLSRRMTISSIFRRNSLIILDSCPTDQSNLTDYLINKHGHADLTTTAKDQLKEQKEFQCTVRFALENRIRMHKLFESKQLAQSSNSQLKTQNSLQSQQSIQQKGPRKHIYHQENHYKNDDLTKIDTNENLNIQQLFVFDTCSMELFGILKLDQLEGQLKKIFCLGGVAYCGFEDGSLVAITVTLSGKNEQPTNRRQLLQPQPEDELIDLRVFNANTTVRMDTIIQQTLAEQLKSRSESMSSKDSISSRTKSSKTNSTSIDEDDDEELVHFDAILMNNSRKNSINNNKSNSVTNSVNNSILNSFSNLSSSITNSITNSIVNSNSNSLFNSISNSKENLKKTNSNSSSEFNFESKKKFKNSAQDGMNGSTPACDYATIVDAKSDHKNEFKTELHSPTRCSRIERNLPSLANIFNNSVNSAFLVLALYKSGKLHCIYLKDGCVQERKLFRIDSKLKSELPIQSLRIMNAFKMNWSEEEVDDSAALNNLINSNDLQAKLNSASELNKIVNEPELDSKLESNNETDKKADESKNENEDIKNELDKELDNNELDNELNNNELAENNRNEVENKSELNGTISQVQTLEDANKECHSSQLNEEFEKSKTKLSKRSSINANQCNYLVTLWSPHPINRLVNVKL